MLPAREGCRVGLARQELLGDHLEVAARGVVRAKARGQRKALRSAAVLRVEDVPRRDDAVLPEGRGSGRYFAGFQHPESQLPKLDVAGSIPVARSLWIRRIIRVSLQSCS